MVKKLKEFKNWKKVLQIVLQVIKCIYYEKNSLNKNILRITPKDWRKIINRYLISTHSSMEVRTKTKSS